MPKEKAMIADARDRWGFLLDQQDLIIRGSRRWRRFGRDLTRRWSFSLLACFSELLLDSPRQFILPLRRHEGILAGHFQVAVARDLRSLDGAAADLLSPGNVGASEGVWPQAGEVAVLGLRRLVEGPVSSASRMT